MYYAIAPLIVGFTLANLSAGVVCLIGGLSSTSILLGKETQKAIVDWMAAPTNVIQPYVDQSFDNLVLPILKIFNSDVESSKEAQLSKEIEYKN
jgi:hypothetical protein